MLWSLGLLALAAVVQLALFIAIQGREPANKTGTAEELSTVVPVTPSSKPVRTTAPAIKQVPEVIVDLPDALPPVDDAPTPPAKVRPSVVGRPVPPPAKPATTGAVTANRIEQPDPAALSRDDVRVLVAEAVRMRRAGDMAGAVGKLNTAIDLLPGHPRVVFEMAATYEAMGMTERAMENYRNIAEMGSARAGALYPIAENRLKNGITVPGQRGPDTESLYLGDIEEILQTDPDGKTVVLRCNVHGMLGRAIDPAAVTEQQKTDLIQLKQRLDTTEISDGL